MDKGNLPRWFSPCHSLPSTWWAITPPPWLSRLISPVSSSPIPAQHTTGSSSSFPPSLFLIYIFIGLKSQLCLVKQWKIIDIISNETSAELTLNYYELQFSAVLLFPFCPFHSFEQYYTCSFSLLSAGATLTLQKQVPSWISPNERAG